MGQIVLNADSASLVLNGRAITSFIAGDILTMTPNAPHSSHIIGSDGGVSINKRADGEVYELLMRIQRFSDDDVFLNAALNAESPVIFNGSLKEDFIRDGQNFKESWTLENGSLTTKPTQTKNDTDGNGVMEYTVMFRRARRNI